VFWKYEKWLAGIILFFVSLWLSVCITLLKTSRKYQEGEKAVRVIDGKLNLDSSNFVQKIEIPISSGDVVLFYDLPNELVFANQTIPLDEPHVLARAEDLWVRFFSVQTKVSLQRKLIKYTKAVFRYKIGYVEELLKLNGLPNDFKYLWLHESDYEDTVTSRAGAVGPCQFMRATAADYGIRSVRFVDERRLFEKAMNGCVKHARDLYDRYGGDVWLTLAAYNCGVICVDNAIKKQHTRDYFQLLLPRETMNFVFWIAFEKEIMENYRRYGLEVSGFSARVINFREDTLDLVRGLRVIDVADSLGISVLQFLYANPFFLKEAGGNYVGLDSPDDIIPKGRWVFRVPVRSR
jgi:hypothetical protein